MTEPTTSGQLRKNGKRTLGLALSGGATRGMAHIGVLKAFEENNIQADFLAGTSIGALVAALHAFGVPLLDIRAKAEEMTWLSISSPTLAKGGLFSNKAIGELIEEFLGDARIEDAPIPLAIIATDISNGDKLVLRRGPLAKAVMASTCVPGIFAPIEWNGRLVVDGFLVENVPVSPLREMKADFVVGVNLSAMRDYREPDSMLNIMMNAFEIAVDANTMNVLSKADLLIEPILYGRKDSEDELPAYFDKGYEAALLKIPRLHEALLPRRSRSQGGFWGSLRSILK